MKFLRPAAIAQHHPTRRPTGKGKTKMRRVGAHPTRKGGLSQNRQCTAFLKRPSSPRPPFHGLPGRKREIKHADRTEGTPGSGKHHRQLRSGHLGDQSPDRCRSTSRLSKAERLHTPDGKGMHRDTPAAFPGSGKRAKRDTTDMNHVRATEPRRRPRGPREPQQVRAGQRSGQTAAPLPSTHHRHTDGVERRGARWQNEKSGRHSQWNDHSS